MKKLFPILLLALLALPAMAATRVTALVTVTNAPTVNGDQIIVNGDTRTFTNVVSDSSSQILTNAAIGGVTTNLYQHLNLTAPAGPMGIRMVGTNAVELRAQVDQALVVTFSGTWANVSYATQTVSSAYTFRVPLTVETATIRTNNASLAVTGISDFSTNSFGETSTALANFVGLTSTQTVSGPKTFSGANIYSNAAHVFDLGYITNAQVNRLKVAYGTTNSGSYFQNSSGNPAYTISPDTAGKPSLYSVAAFTDTLGTAANYTPDAAHILSRTIADNYYGRLNSINTWGATNYFLAIQDAPLNNPTIVGGSISGVTLNGTGGLITGGIYSSPVTTNLINKGNPLQSFTDADLNVEIGKNAKVTNTFLESIAIGYNAKAGASDAIAIGEGAEARYANSIAIGNGAVTAAAQEMLFGGAGILSWRWGNSAANYSHILGTVAIGSTGATTGAGSNNLLLRSGTSPLGLDVGDVAIWGASGVPYYAAPGEMGGVATTLNLHNKTETANGTSGDYSLTATYALADFVGTDPSVVLSTAGTYLIIAEATIIAGGTANDEYRIKLVNTTDSTDVANSERIVSNIQASQRDQITATATYTVTSAKTVKLYARNSTAARGSVEAATTSLIYVRLY